MADKPVPRMSMRNFLGLDPLPPIPQHYVKRPSQRTKSSLLPTGQGTAGPFEDFVYGSNCKIVTYKDQVPKNDAPVKKDDDKKDDADKGKKPADDEDKKPGDDKPGDDKGDKKGSADFICPDCKTDCVKKEEKPAGDDGFTKEQDDELMKFKNENTSWAAISTAMGKPVQALKTRFGEIKPKDWRPQQGKTAAKGGAAEEKKDEGKNKTKKKDDKPAEKTQADGKGEDMISVYDFDGKEYRRHVPDRRFTPSVLNFAGEFDDEWYWQNMAARMFDKFGKRYTPEELKARMHR